MPSGGSSDSEDSILSHITVVAHDSPSPPRATAMTAPSRSSVGASSLQSTPPTSLDGSTGDMDAPKSVKNRRVSRARSSLSTLASHNDGEPSSAKRNAGGVVKDEPQSITGSRAVSGATLVEKEKDEETPRKKKRGDQLDIDMHWDMAEDASGNDNADGPKRRASRRSQIGIKAGEAGKSIAEATSSLGKRARDAMDTVKEKASAATTRTTRAKAPESPPKRAKYEPTGRLFPNLPRATPKEEAKEEDNQPKEAPKPVKAPRTRKLYQTQGLYAGQTRTFDPMVKEGTNKKKVSAAAATEAPRENSVLPLPMFGAHKRLTIEETKTTGFAHFKLPFDVLLPLRKEQNPKDWSKLSKNRFIGDAAATWNTKEWKKIDSSYCGCKGKCEEDCINRSMSYECNDKICDNGEECGNRPFAELAFRYKNKNFSRLREGEKAEANLWGEGVETMSTNGRGFGVRAMRPFKPNQIIVEYTGEIINQQEADRRMNEDYKDKTDYYLMDFHDGMIIDATRGSICRFVNHSCDPNCRVEKHIVNGEPRMALFAGDEGIMTGEELTYDYNFEVFSKNSTQACLCGAENCRGVLGPKPKDRPSKAKQLAGAIKGAMQGVKRKVERMIGGDDDEPVAEKKRVKISAKEVVNKIRKQISTSAPAVAVPDPKVAQANKDQRAKRAAERLAREQAEREAAEADDEDADAGAGAEEEMPRKTERRRSMSTTIQVSDLPRTTSKASASPAKRMSSVKKRVADTLKAAVSSTPAPRTTSQTPLLKSSSSSSASADPKSMRQSRLSFGPASFGFNVSPKKGAVANGDDAEEDDEDASSGPTIPKRKSSLKADTSKQRPSTAKSLVKGVSKVAAAAKVGVQGDKAIRKTIRAVSGAE